MENNIPTPEPKVVKSHLHSVTPLSKYLAMALFIFLPFVGGWIGYMYSPEKVVEVEKLVVIGTPSDTETEQSIDVEMEEVIVESFTSQLFSDWITYRIPEYNFEVSAPSEYEFLQDFHAGAKVHSFALSNGKSRVWIVPKGEYDRGLSPYLTETEGFVDGLKVKKLVIDGFEYITFIDSNLLPESWSEEYGRIEISWEQGHGSVTSEMLSTFKFID